MRIALVNNFFPPRPTGSSHLTDELARIFTAEGHDVVVVTASYGDAPDVETIHGGAVVHRLPAWRLPESRLAFDYDIRFTLPARNHKRFRRILDDFGPDVIHQHGQFFDLAFLSAWYARKRCVPHLTSVHARLEHDNAIVGGVFAAVDRSVIRGAINWARSHVVVMDKRMEEYISRRYRTDQSRLVYIPVGIDVGRFDPSAAPDLPDVRSIHRLDDRPVLLSLGHITPFRNRVAVVRTVAALKERGIDFQCVIVGGEHDSKFREEAERLGVLDDLILTGAVPKEQITAFLAIARIEMHDLQQEGFGTASLEALAAGVPVITDIDPDNFPTIPIESGHQMVLVPPGNGQRLIDEVAALMSDPDRRRELGASGREWVRRHFAIEQVARQHLKAYESVLQTR